MASNPIVEFKKHVDKEAAARKQTELEHLQRWRDSGDPQHLQPLLQAYEPVIAQKVRQWKAPSVPEAAFRAELKTHVLQAFQTYDPNRGAALNTHVENTMRKAQRYNVRYQNFAHIPEAQVAKIAPITKAQNELTDMLGRPPTNEEIADHIGEPLKNVNRVLKAQVADVQSSKFESDPNAAALQRDEEILSLLPFSLDPEEKQVFDYLYGDKKHMKPASMGALAKQLGMNNSRLSRVHSRILNKYKSYR